MSKRCPPWQWQVGDYVVRDGGIYLRAFNVRLAKFAPNSAQLQSALGRMFDAAHCLVASEMRALEKLPKVKSKSKTVMVRGKKHWRAAKEFRE